VAENIPTSRWKLNVDTVKHQTEDPTTTDGPPLDHGHQEPAADVHDHDLPPPPMDASQMLGFDEPEDSTSEWSDQDEKTIHRGSHPPKPSSSRRISPALMSIFKRRREQIGLSIEQVAKMAGVEENEYMRFEATQGGHRLIYDHAIVIAKVLGVPPADMPGLRPLQGKDETVATKLTALEQALVAGPLLVFEGQSGERFGGDIERVIVTPGFALKIGDASLGDIFPRGAVLGFSTGAVTRDGDIVLLRHKKNKQLALRRLSGVAYSGIASWQQSFLIDSGEWIVAGRLQVLIPTP
jgi:transcriptional regulator with XRE-family HTH domain